MQQNRASFALLLWGWPLMAEFARYSRKDVESIGVLLTDGSTVAQLDTKLVFVLPRERGQRFVTRRFILTL